MKLQKLNRQKLESASETGRDFFDDAEHALLPPRRRDSRDRETIRRDESQTGTPRGEQENAQEEGKLEEKGRIKTVLSRTGRASTRKFFPLGGTEVVSRARVLVVDAGRRPGGVAR